MTTEQTTPPLSALLSFTAENARSYRDEVHFSLLAGRLTPKSIVRTLPTAGQPVRVLPAAGVFGANASGKSTLLQAMADLRALVVDSFRSGGPVSWEGGVANAADRAFRLVPSPPPEPWIEHDGEPLKHLLRATRYEVDLIVCGVLWEYGLEAGAFGVVSEYAYHYPNGRRALVFRRERGPSDDGGQAADDFVFGPPFRKSGQGLRRFVRPSVPLLSVAGPAGFEPLAGLHAWFLDNLHLSERADREYRVARTVELLEQPHTRQRVLALLRAADLGVVDVVRDSVPAEIRDFARRARELRRTRGDALDSRDDEDPLEDSIEFIHSGPWGDVRLSRSDESMGTLVWAGFVGPLLDALTSGSVLLVDELDSSLHARLVDEVVDLFQRPRRNPNAAQLVFNAHDVTLLGDTAERTLGRDQIWFTDKQHDGATRLYPLSDFGPRHDEAVERRYRQGRYGGVPAINPAGFEQLARAAGE